MCLFVLPAGKIETAKQDMVVYKILLKDGKRSPYRRFRYAPDTLYRLRKALKVRKTCSRNAIHEGFHAISNKATAVARCSWTSNKIVEMTIPKGAKYCKGKNDEIVSTSMRSGSLKAMRKS